MWNLNIKLSARMTVLLLALLLATLLLVGVVALHAAHSITWHTLSLLPNVPFYGP